MRPERDVFACASLLFVVCTSHAAICQESLPPIATDRPSIAASSSVVPSFALQVENGIAETSKQSARTFDAPETQLRFGATSSTELRLTLPNALIDDQPMSATGVADLTFGLKQQIVKRPRGAMSVIFTLSVPSGSADVSSHGYDPSLQAPWSVGIKPRWTLAGMFSISGPTVDGRRTAMGQVSILVDRELTARWNTFLEYSVDIPQTSSATHLLHTGAAFKATHAQQLDVHVGVGLSGGLDWLVGGGYSLRIGGHRDAER
jgi:hypothetical protein